MRTSYGPTLHRLTACHSDWYSLNPNPRTLTAWKRISFGNSRTFGGPNLFPVFVYYVPLNGPQGVGWSTEHTYFDPCCNTIIRAQHAPTQDSDFDSTQIHGPPLILIGKGKNKTMRGCKVCIVPARTRNLQPLCTLLSVILVDDIMRIYWSTRILLNAHFTSIWMSYHYSLGTPPTKWNHSSECNNTERRRRRAVFVLLGSDMWLCCLEP